MEPRHIIPTTQATCQVCGLAWPVALEMGLEDMVRYCIRYHHALHVLQEEEEGNVTA